MTLYDEISARYLALADATEAVAFGRAVIASAAGL